LGRFALVALAATVVAGAALVIAVATATTGRRGAPSDDILEHRRAYHERFRESDRLLALLENGSCRVMMTNPHRDTRFARSDLVFFGSSRIRRELGIDPADAPSRKARKIFRFVQARVAHKRPLYIGDHLHHPAHFLSTYSAGFCDDSASVFVELARLVELPARTVWIEDQTSSETIHVAAEVFHEGNWRVYDADLFGIIREPDGTIATFEYLATLAGRGLLSPFPGAGIRARRLRDAARWIDLGEPWIQLLPGEQRHYLDELTMLGTDGIESLDGVRDRRAFLGHYEDRMANYVRAIPVMPNGSFEDEMEVRDYFPIVGAFLIGAGATGRAVPAAAEILVESARMANPAWRALSEFPVIKREGLDIVDLSSSLRVLEPEPSFAVRLRGIRALLRVAPGARLVTVHPYARRNADFSPASLATLETKGIVVQLCHRSAPRGWRPVRGRLGGTGTMPGGAAAAAADQGATRS
jgi:hypothetical protein